MSRPHLGRTARLTVRLPPEHAEWLAAEARRRNRSVNHLLVELVRAAAEGAT